MPFPRRDWAECYGSGNGPFTTGFRRPPVGGFFFHNPTPTVAFPNGDEPAALAGRASSK